MAKTLEPIPGTSDLWEPEVSQWVRLENAAREVFSLYGYGEIRTPVFERTEVFVGSIGEETEVVQKEMYTFEDRGGRSLTLRPEGTAGVLRAIAYSGLQQGEEKRVFYTGPMFRGERPAAGRRRQFHQIGVEAVGRSNPYMDAECIAMAMRYLDELGLDNVRLLLNSRGVPEERIQASEGMRAYFSKVSDALCEDCQNRLQRNVWRILDCKQEGCQEIIENAPAVLSLMGKESNEFFDEVVSQLDTMGVKYELAPRLVRGLDYYEHTVFELVSDSEQLGAQNALAGGGRYQVSLPGSSKKVPGVGFALGMERLLMALGVTEQPKASMADIQVYMASLGNAKQAAFSLAEKVRSWGIHVFAENENKSMKAQMRAANKFGATAALILGDDESANNTVICKHMETGEQVELPQADLQGHLQQILGAC
jgi:histidyl-tRNA synthetase